MSQELREALASADVSPLIQKQIDPVLLEYVRRYSPLVAAIPTKPWSSTIYYFNQRTGLAQGGFVTDGGANSVTTSTYVQSSFTLKLLQNVGSVTGFAQAVTRDLVGDLKAKELQGATQGLVWDIETAAVWGNANATVNGQAPQFDGFDAQVNTWSGTAQNAVDKAGAALALADLDNLIDLVEENAAMPLQSDWMIVLSPGMNSSVSQLLTNQQRFQAPQIEIAAGLNVPSYRDLPFVKSSFLSPRGQAGPTVASSTGSSATASIASSQVYYYQVSAVMGRFGETLASTVLSITASSSGSSQNTLTITAPSNVDGAGPILYKVYRGTASSGANGPSLLGIVDAKDKGGTAVTSIIDTGTNLLTNSSAQTGPSAYVGGSTGHLPRATGYEDIFLVPRNEDFLVRPFTRELQVINLAPTTSAPDTLPFAIVSDCTLAFRGPKYCGRLRNVKTTF